MLTVGDELTVEQLSPELRRTIARVVTEAAAGAVTDVLGWRNAMAATNANAELRTRVLRALNIHDAL